MGKTFDKPFARNVCDRINEAVKVLEDELGLTLKVVGGRFGSDTLTVKIEAKLVDGDEVVVSDLNHKMVDSTAERMGIKFTGHLIGSCWRTSKGKLLRVTDYKRSNRSYPILLVDSDGSRSKASFSFLTTAEQLLMPTYSEFKIWLSVDPDSDKVKESDVEIWDGVQDYFSVAYSPDLVDEFFSLVDSAVEKGLSLGEMKGLYKELSLSIKTAIIYLKQL